MISFYHFLFLDLWIETKRQSQRRDRDYTKTQRREIQQWHVYFDVLAFSLLRMKWYRKVHKEEITWTEIFQFSYAPATGESFAHRTQNTILSQITDRMLTYMSLCHSMCVCSVACVGHPTIRSTEGKIEFEFHRNFGWIQNEARAFSYVERKTFPIASRRRRNTKFLGMPHELIGLKNKIEENFRCSSYFANENCAISF